MRSIAGPIVSVAIAASVGCNPVIYGSPAAAYTCKAQYGCGTCDYQPSANSLSYHIHDASFTSVQEDLVRTAASAWDAGEAELLTGMTWNYQFSSLTSGYSTSNSRFDVFMETGTWFVNKGCVDGNAAIGCALATTTAGCAIWERNIAVNSDNTYAPQRVENAPAGSFSLAQVIMHEFGHHLGLGHLPIPSAHAATMEDGYPGAADLGSKFRVGEDEYDFMQEQRPADSSVGVNLMPGKWITRSGIGEDLSFENKGMAVLLTSGLTFSDPVYMEDLEISLHLTGTSTVSGVKVQWSASPNDVCFDGDDVVLATSGSIGMGVGTPFQVKPTSIKAPVVTGTVPKVFHQCAKVDALTTVTETSEEDNVVKFKNTFTVYP